MLLVVVFCFRVLHVQQASLRCYSWEEDPFQLKYEASGKDRWEEFSVEKLMYFVSEL